MRWDGSHFVQLQSILSLTVLLDHNQHITSAPYHEQKKMVGKQNDSFHAVFSVFYFVGSYFNAWMQNASEN